MTTQQTMWPSFPPTLPYEVTVSRPLCLASAGVVLPSTVMLPCCYNMVVEKPSPTVENRKLFLYRSVFELVDAHIYLALTDPKLLGWYLHLCPEDRKIIQDEGGFHQFLQRHPALELSRNHVYVKYNADNIGTTRPAQPVMTSNNHTYVSQSTMSGAKKCKSEMPHTHLDMEVFPNMRETLTLPGCSNSRDGSIKHPYEGDSFQTAFSSPITQEPIHQKAQTVKGSSCLNEQWPSWQMANCSSSADVSKDPAALASFSLDMELERCRQWGKPELRRSQTAMIQGQRDDFTCAGVNPLQSEWSTTEKDSSLEYHSFDSIQLDRTEYSDRSVIQLVELEQVSSPLDPAEENNTMEACQDHRVCGNENTDEAVLSFEDESENFRSIMEDDKSIVVCLTSKNVKAHNSEVHSGPVTTDSEAQAASSETLKSDQCVAKTNTAEKSTSTEPCISTCDIMVGTEVTQSMSAATQTEDPETADKHVITEVHMADLDYLAEEFIRLNKAQEALSKQKEKRKSSGCKLRKECDCIQRAQQAELCLLALQYSMCRQHSWRLYCISTEGGQLSSMPKKLSANIVSVLQKLESDYNQMRDEILAGVPLEQLKPLSVDSENITIGESYIPAQMIGDVLENVPSCSQEPQVHNASGEEKGCLDSQSRNGCQVKKENRKARRAATLVPQDRDAVHNADKPEEKQTKAECKELSTCEAWYDAEEDLEPEGPAVAAATGQDPTVIAKDKTHESASEEAKSSVLSVSNLPSNVTESDVKLWFQKYHPSEVSISALGDDLRVAIVKVSGPQSAEAAVRELNGCCKQGHAFHVERITRAIGGSQKQASASISGPESSQDDAKPQNCKTDLSSTERKLITQPPLSSSFKNRKVVCISPTAKATCVPQHFGTMGSFDTLMAELTQRHPDVGRQRIVDALVELKAKHRGVLSGLPLRTIREMTSELLTGPASDTQL